MFSEPNHPRFAQYTLESTKRWSATIAALDAFVFVSPEYNHGYPGMLKHLLDTCLKEYIHKAVGICGSGTSGFR